MDEDKIVESLIADNFLILTTALEKQKETEQEERGFDNGVQA